MIFAPANTLTGGLRMKYLRHWDTNQGIDFIERHGRSWVRNAKIKDINFLGRGMGA